MTTVWCFTRSYLKSKYIEPKLKLYQFIICFDKLIQLSYNLLIFITILSISSFLKIEPIVYVISYLYGSSIINFTLYYKLKVRHTLLRHNLKVFTYQPIGTSHINRFIYGKTTNLQQTCGDHLQTYLCVCSY
jgi:hypothetical protein